MRTAGDIARRALVRSGVLAAGETPSAAEISDAVTTLSDMLDSWSLERLAVFGTTEHVIPIAGPTLTIGPTGDIVAARPNAFVSAFVRANGRDVPVSQASPTYLDSVCHKDGPGDAHWLSLEGAMPDAIVRLWPVPAGGVLHLRVTQPMVAITDPADELDLPPGWFQALVLNLAVHLCEEYGQGVTDMLASLAQNAKGSIKRANIQPAVATYDTALTLGSRWRETF